MSVRPAELVHRGTVRAAGYYFDAALLPAAECRRRILALWRPGCAAYRAGGGWVVRLSRAETVRCECAPGLPLTHGAGGVLLGCPLTGDELKMLASPAGAAVLVVGGVATPEPLREDRREDPAGWIDLGTWGIAVESSLGRAPEPPVLSVEQPEFDARKKLSGIPEASPASIKALEALNKAGRGAAAASAAGGTLVDAVGAVAAGLFVAGSLIGHGVMSLLGPLLRLLPLPTAPSSAAAKAEPRKPPPAWHQLYQRMLGKMLMLTRLSNLIGRAQAKYIGRMMEMFERGDMLEALRHAIPLGGEGDGFHSWALGVPSPRLDLNLSFGGGGPGSSLMVGGIYERLRELYRSAFERLEREGRIDEAAFVLAELLQDSEAAVAFLERHGRLKTAAELAEARNLSAALIVRQWFVAGDRERAVLIARRTGAFADAIARLVPSHPELAGELRRAWAESLASAGDYPAAVEAIWPLADARPEALQWLDFAAASGGVTAARMLARKVGLVPEQFAAVREQVLPLLDDEDPELGAARSAFADELCGGPNIAETRVLARAAARALTRDLPRTHLAGGVQAVRRIAKFSADSAVAADLPRLEQVSPPRPFRGRGDLLRLDLEAGNTGTLPISDAALLADGRCLVALGEVGVRLLSRSGAVSSHFDQPAHHLVVADHGRRAIVLGRRGDVYRLARLDLETFRAESWCEAQLDHFATTYDGSVWYGVTRSDGLVVLDALSGRLSALWRNRELAGKIFALARSTTNCSLLVYGIDPDPHRGAAQAPPTWQRWIHEIPGPRLRYRPQLPEPEAGLELVGRNLDAAGEVVDLWQVSDSSDVQLGAMGTSHRVPLLGVWARDVLALRREGGWIALAAKAGSEVQVLLYEMGDGARGGPPLVQRLQLLLRGAQTASVRLTPELLTVADDRGRLLVFDLERGVLLRNLRVG